MKQCFRLAGLTVAAALISGCADRGSMAYRLHDPGPSYQEDPSSTETAESENDPQAAEVVQAEADPVIAEPSEPAPQGPMVLTRPIAPLPAPRIEEENNRRTVEVAEEPENRFAFLGWFGRSARNARVSSPVEELRKSRTIIASAQPQTSVVPPHGLKPPVIVGENARLMPTFSEGLENPNGSEPALRGAEITGSITRPQSAPPKPESPPLKTTDLRKPEPVKKTALEPVVAAAKPAIKPLKVAVAPVPPRQDLPDLDNPLRIELSAGINPFGPSEIETLRRIAALHKSSGRPVHIRAVSRGRAGGTTASLTRARRMHGHTTRAIAELTRMGVDPNRISTAIDEQLTTGEPADDTIRRDRDRLELSLN